MPWLPSSPFDRPGPGNIVVLDSMYRGEPGDHGPAHLGVVLSSRAVRWRRAALGVINVALVSAFVEAASEADAYLAASETGAPYDVIVRTDIVAPIFRWQIGATIGAVPLDLLGPIELACGGDTDALPLERRGQPFAVQRDLRRGVRRGDLAALEALAADCRRDVIKDPLTAVDRVSVRDAVPGVFTRLSDPSVVLPPAYAEPTPRRVAGLGIDVDVAVVTLGAEQRALGFMGAATTSDASIPRWSPEAPPSLADDDALQEWLGAVAQAGRRSCRVLSTVESSSSHRFMAPGGIPMQVTTERLVSSVN